MDHYADDEQRKTQFGLAGFDLTEFVPVLPDEVPGHERNQNAVGVIGIADEPSIPHPYQRGEVGEEEDKTD